MVKVHQDPLHLSQQFDSDTTEFPLPRNKLDNVAPTALKDFLYPTTADTLSTNQRQYSEPVSSATIHKVAELLKLCKSCPQRQIPKFDGNLMKYWMFKRAFPAWIKNYAMDTVDKLACLIDACEGEALEAIEQCLALEPEIGYAQAWKILDRRFGNPL